MKRTLEGEAVVEEASKSSDIPVSVEPDHYIYEVVETSRLDDYKNRGQEWTDTDTTLFRTKKGAQRFIWGKQMEYVLDEGRVEEYFSGKPEKIDKKFLIDFEHIKKQRGEDSSDDSESDNEFKYNYTIPNEEQAERLNEFFNILAKGTYCDYRLEYSLDKKEIVNE